MAYGMRPIQVAGAGYNTGGFEEFPIDVSAQTTNIWNGDIVKLTGEGEIERDGDTPTEAAPCLGVFVGCRYVDPDGRPTWNQKYVGNTSNTEAYGMVCTDPNMTFLIQSDTAWATTQRGLGAVLTIANGSDTTGNSGNSLVITSGAGDTALRIIGVPKNGENETSSTPNVIVKWQTPEILLYNNDLAG